MLLYGQHLGLNHLQAVNQISVHIGHNLLDQSSTDNTVDYVKKGIRLNLHCWHTDDRFSKFYFKANRYNDSELVQYVNDTTARAYVRLNLDVSLFDFSLNHDELLFLGDENGFRIEEDDT